MDKQTIIEAKAILQKQKQSAENLAQNHLNTALKNPEFKKAYETYTNLMIKNAKLEAFGKKVDKEGEEGMKLGLRDLCKKLNISNIEPNYACKKCDDCGIVDGKYCECLKKEVSNLLLQKSNFGKLEDFKNSNFDLFENKDEFKKIYDLMFKWCKKTDSDKNLIYLFGEVGTGKTHLIRCMANEFIAQNKLVNLTTAFNLSQELLKYHTSFEKGKQLNNLLNCEILFIDDLGTEPFYKNITREYTYLIINERRAKNLKTIITSNLDLADLRERYDERVFSRIIDKDASILINLKGCDKRKKRT